MYSAPGWPGCALGPRQYLTSNEIKRLRPSSISACHPRLRTSSKRASQQARYLLACGSDHLAAHSCA
eukprot:850229-Alexandrium_andersonii.AAC.1